MEVSDQLEALAAFLLGKDPLVLDEHQSQYGYCGEEKNLFPLLGIKLQFLGDPSHSQSCD
jgi:hypothetical protein